MRAFKTELDGVMLLTPKIYEDFRGTNHESYNEAEYEKVTNTKFIVDSISTSRKHVLRGIHGDYRTTKLISCLYGEIYFVVINMNRDSPQYLHWQDFTLTERNKHQVLVPPGFGNGHLVMSDNAVFSYKLDQYYDRDSQFTVKWDDDIHNIWWPVGNPILSLRDS